MVGTASTAADWRPERARTSTARSSWWRRALEEHGPLELEELKRLVGGRYWGPGRFRAALRAATDEGAADRTSRTVFAPPVDVTRLHSDAGVSPRSR